MEKFNDPIKPRSVKPPHTPVDGKNSPWDFRCPEYDQRTSVFIKAGDDYNMGFNQPIGHDGNPKLKTAAMPDGCKTIELPK